MQSLLVGVDGGGSKTRVLLADERGERIAETSGPSSAVRPGAAQQSASVIAGLIREVLAIADRNDVVPRVCCMGIAGVGRESERQALWEALMALRVGEEIAVETDFAIALADAFDDGAGVLLVAGTGSAAFGRGPSGATARCGGWGPVIGDEGGGSWIGRRALSVVAAASDGREPETALTGAVLTATECGSAADLIPWAAAATPALLATLAPVVLSVAEAGDLRANSIASMAVEELSLHVRALARTLFTDERASLRVALTGGLLRKGSSFRKRLEHRLRTSVPGAELHAGEVDAARGAVRLAVRHLSELAV